MVGFFYIRGSDLFLSSFLGEQLNATRQREPHPGALYGTVILWEKEVERSFEPCQRDRNGRLEKVCLWYEGF